VGADVRGRKCKEKNRLDVRTESSNFKKRLAVEDLLVGRVWDVARFSTPLERAEDLKKRVCGIGAQPRGCPRQQQRRCRVHLNRVDGGR
jgi:hypothetical protein